MAAPTPKHAPASSTHAPARGSRGGRRTYLGRAWLALEIIAAYAQSRRALRHAPIETVVAGLRSHSPAIAPAGPDSLDQARRLGWVVARLLAYVPGDTRCLARSLVLTRLLARRGIQAKVVIGASAAPDFLAHAWVEHDGIPVLNAGDPSFARLVEL